MKYLAVLLLLFSPLAVADQCINSHGNPTECFGNGSVSEPALSVGNEGTGLFSSGNGDLRFAVLGIEVAHFDVKQGWVVPATASRWVETGGVHIKSGVGDRYGLYIDDDEATGSRPWAINSTSKANSQITGGLNNTPIGQTAPAPGTFTTGTFVTAKATTFSATTFNAARELKLNGNLLAYAAEPTIVSGFGDSAAVNHSNGSASFTVLVSSTGASSRGVIGMPKAKNGWACSAADVSAPDRSMTQQTGSSPTSVTLTNYIRTTGIPGNWSQNDVIEVTCFPN